MRPPPPLNRCAIGLPTSPAAPRLRLCCALLHHQCFGPHRPSPPVAHPRHSRPHLLSHRPLRLPRWHRLPPRPFPPPHPLVPRSLLLRLHRRPFPRLPPRLAPAPPGPTFNERRVSAKACRWACMRTSRAAASASLTAMREVRLTPYAAAEPCSTMPTSEWNVSEYW